MIFACSFWIGIDHPLAPLFCSPMRPRTAFGSVGVVTTPDGVFVRTCQQKALRTGRRGRGCPPGIKPYTTTTTAPHSTTKTPMHRPRIVQPRFITRFYSLAFRFSGVVWYSFLRRTTPCFFLFCVVFLRVHVLFLEILFAPCPSPMGSAGVRRSGEFPCPRVASVRDHSRHFRQCHGRVCHV